MGSKRAFVTLGLLLVFLHKAATQGMAPASPAAAPTMPAMTAPAAPGGTPSGMSMAPAAGPGTPASAPAPAQNQSAPSGQQSSDIATYLNRKIRQVLNENPAKDTAESRLAGVFNAQRNNLENALIMGAGSEDAFSKAEQAVSTFRNFAQQYGKIDNMLQNALDDLNGYQDNAKYPIETRYMALLLQSKLGSSSSLKDAEAALQLYAGFKRDSSNDFNSGAAPMFPPFNDEYRKYFEEIITILRRHFSTDSPQMTNILQQILMNPQHLRQILSALLEAEEEDDLLDFLLDFFSF